MEPIYCYLDYRVFLREYYKSRKKSGDAISYRYMAKHLDMDAGYLVKLVQGKVHLSNKHLKDVNSFCSFDTKEAAYFKTLVLFNKAKQENKIKQLFEKLLSISDISYHKLDRGQFEYYNKWYYPVVRALIAQMDFKGDYKLLAKKLSPKITEAQARKAVQLLVTLGLIARNENGTYDVLDSTLSTGAHWKSAAIKQFQRETIKKAEESLDRHAKELRDISSITLGISQRDLPVIREQIAGLRKSLIRLSNNTDNADSVYQLNVQLFPFSHVAGRINR